MCLVTGNRRIFQFQTFRTARSQRGVAVPNFLPVTSYARGCGSCKHGNNIRTRVCVCGQAKDVFARKPSRANLCGPGALISQVRSAEGHRRQRLLRIIAFRALSPPAPPPPPPLIPSPRAVRPGLGRRAFIKVPSRPSVIHARGRTGVNLSWPGHFYRRRANYY